MRDARVLRTLILLDLESHPPPAAIDVGRGRAGRRARPHRAGLAARPHAAVAGRSRDARRAAGRAGGRDARRRAGAGRHARRASRGDERAFRFRDRGSGVPKFAGQRLTSAIRQLRTSEPRNRGTADRPIGFRRFRLPIAARVVDARGAPVRVASRRARTAGGRVVALRRALAIVGPLVDARSRPAGIATSGTSSSPRRRLPPARDRATGHWEIEGVVD